MGSEIVIQSQPTGPNKPEGQAQQQPASKPEWLPEKFNSPEDLAKAYQELEKKLGQPRPEAQSPASTNQPSDGGTDQAAREAVESVGLDFTTFQEEYNTTGNLSDASIEALVQRGIPRSAIDQYIAGAQALAEKYTQEFYGLTGGEEGLNQALQWAAKGLSKAEVEAYNRVMDSGDMAAMKLAVQGLMANYQRHNPTEPNLYGGSTSATSTGRFESVAQVTEAMRDPRYRSDEAYRKQVQERLGRSNIF